MLLRVIRPSIATNVSAIIRLGIVIRCKNSPKFVYVPINEYPGTYFVMKISISMLTKNDGAPESTSISPEIAASEGLPFLNAAATPIITAITEPMTELIITSPNVIGSLDIIRPFTS